MIVPPATSGAASSGIGDVTCASNEDRADSDCSELSTSTAPTRRWLRLAGTLRRLWLKVQKRITSVATSSERDHGVIDWESHSFPNVFKVFTKREVRLHRREEPIHGDPRSSSIASIVERIVCPECIEHSDDTFDRHRLLIDALSPSNALGNPDELLVLETDEHLPPKEFEQPEEIFAELRWKSDDDIAAKEFEEPDPWDIQHPDEDDDLIPPHEPDDYVSERIDDPWTDRDDLDDIDYASASKTKRQPATDIPFKERRIGGDREITTPWQAYMCGAEKTRLTLMACTTDLKGFSGLARLQMGRFREKAEGKYSLNERLPGDKWSAGDRKLQVSLRSMVAGASVTGVPDEAVSFVTVDFAATPELSVWLKAGGARPEAIFGNGMKRINAALKDVGAVHVMREGFSEVAQAVNAADENERCAQYAKAYAREHWPEGLSWDDHSHAVFVEHIHGVFALLDKDCQPIAAERFGEALRKQFPLPRAVRVEGPRDSRWAPGASLSEKVAAAIRYNITKKRALSEAEVVENIRWHKELQPEHIFFSGWTSFVDARVMSVPIMRSSLLARQNLQDALVDFDIGPGRRVEAASDIAHAAVRERDAEGTVVRLDEYRRSRSASPVRSRTLSAEQVAGPQPRYEGPTHSPVESPSRLVIRFMRCRC